MLAELGICKTMKHGARRTIVVLSKVVRAEREDESTLGRGTRKWTSEVSGSVGGNEGKDI